MEGNTPTSVGKTRLSNSANLSTKKHPHERGENSFAFNNLTILKETPPRAWGKHTGIEQNVKTARNTPTSVGKTQ